MNAPLEGVKVLDFSMGVAGPHAGHLCALYGADVIKIEPPDGEWGRLLSRPVDDLSPYSIVVNRGKRSLAIDLKDPEARAIITGMAAEADVIIEAFRPGVMKKFGLDYESVRARNAKVVYVSITGFGQTGPRSTLAANDSVIQAYSGFMFANRDQEGNPQRLDFIIMDVVTGLYAYQAIANALIARFRGRAEGTYIDCSLMQAAAALQAVKLMDFHIVGPTQAMYTPNGVFATKDGFITLSTMQEHHFQGLCAALERPALAADPRFCTRPLRNQNKDALLPLLRAALKEQTTAEWQRRLTARDVLHAPVRTYTDLLDDEQLKLRNAISWIEQSGLPAPMPVVNLAGAPPSASPCPHIGEHSIEVLGEQGLDTARIAALLARGVVKARASTPR